MTQNKEHRKIRIELIFENKLLIAITLFTFFYKRISDGNIKLKKTFQNFTKGLRLNSQ